MRRHVVALPGFGALKSLSAYGWAGPGADFISGPNVLAWKTVPGPKRGAVVARGVLARRAVGTANGSGTQVLWALFRWCPTDRM